MARANVDKDDDEMDNNNDENNDASIANNLKKVKLTIKQKHERHQTYVSSALAVAAAAARDGATQEAAIEFGKKEGSKNASSWADIARSGNV